MTICEAKLSASTTTAFPFSTIRLSSISTTITRGIWATVRLLHHGATPGHHVPLGGHEHGPAVYCQRNWKRDCECPGRAWADSISRRKLYVFVSSSFADSYGSLIPRLQLSKELLHRRSEDLIMSRGSFVSSDRRAIIN